MNVMYVHADLQLDSHTHKAFISWVIVPLILMVDSYKHIAGTLRKSQAAKVLAKAK